MIIVAALLANAVPAPNIAGSPSFAGSYEVHQMEMAGALELNSNGHFRYAFDYGAVSETAEGEWAADGAGIVLTSNPMPKAPSFELVADDPAPKGELWMMLEDPGFEWGTPLKAVAITAADAGPGLEVSAPSRVR